MLKVAKSYYKKITEIQSKYPGKFNKIENRFFCISCKTFVNCKKTVSFRTT